MLQLLLLTVLAASQSHAAPSAYYTAAVVELSTPRLPANWSADEVLLYNTAVYLDYMFNASLSKVDMIVFPEGGLVGHYNEGKALELPSAADNATPCDNDNTTALHQVLTMLSCAARKYRMYTVVSIAEAFDNKTMNKTQLFTSSLAFDRNGTTVARYRKYHPYGKSADKPPLEFQYFETDFGVTFGMLISFDIQFLEPGIVLAREYGIKHFVFPHCWVSALPFFTAVQTQWAWAYGLDVVLLASGCNDPSSGATGSGLYHGRLGALQYLQTSHVTSSMLVARVPTSIESQRPVATFEDSPTPAGSNKEHYEAVTEPILDPGPIDPETRHTNTSLYLLRDYVDVYESLLLLPTERVEPLVPHNLTTDSSATVRLTTETSLCHNRLCCNFQITVASTFNATPLSPQPRPDDFSHLFYRLVAFDGVRSYGGGVATGGIQVCGVISCVNESMSSCGLAADHPSVQIAAIGPLHKASTVFEAASISANFVYNSTFIYPDILVTGTGYHFGSLVSSDSFSFFTSAPQNGSVYASLKMETPVSRLVTAAIYARQFDRDGQQRTELPFTSKAHSLPRQLLGIFTLFLLSFVNIFFKDVL